MDSREKPNIVSTKRGERRRKGGQWEGPVSHWPETRIEDQHTKLTLTVQVTL